MRPKSAKKIEVLLVEDNPADARLIKEMLLDFIAADIVLTHMSQLSDALLYLEEKNADIILLDMTLPDSEWPQTLIRTIACAPDVPVVVLTGLDDEERAINAVKKGAQDYLFKGNIDSALIGRTILYAIERQRLSVLLREALQSTKEMEEVIRLEKERVEELNRTLEQRVMEEVSSNLEKERLLLQQSRQAAMGEMIGNIAHQWRQPLNTLGLLIQDILHAYQYGELNKEYLGKTIEEGMNTINFMSQTIDDFRNFFRPDKEKTTFNLKETILKTLTFVENSYKDKDISIELDTCDDIVITGYPNEYSQVLLNILNNAKDIFVERMIDGPHIKIKLFMEQGKSVLTVTDNGGGIEDDIISRIFDPYFTTKEQGKGTGVGLYMSKTIIEKNMEGRLSAGNVMYNGKKGAEFRIEV